MLLCLILIITKYESRVKWSNQGKGVAPSLHLVEVANEKELFESLTLLISMIY